MKVILGARVRVPGWACGSRSDKIGVVRGATNRGPVITTDGAHGPAGSVVGYVTVATKWLVEFDDGSECYVDARACEVET